MQINTDAQIKASALNIPIEWAEAFYLLRDVNRPKRIERNRWLSVHYCLMELYEDQPEILKAIITSNWNLLDIFGCHYSAPTRRFDCRGLLLAKRHQDKIAEVTNESIKIKKPNGTIQGIYKPLIALPERVLLYELS